MRPQRLIAALILVAACRGTATRVTVDTSDIDPRDPHAAERMGERMYRARCAVCHQLRDPASRTAKGWVWAVAEYGPDAKLTPEESQQILVYLTKHAKPDSTH